MAWTSPRTWVASEVVTAALLNTHVRDNLKALGDPWTAYTPAWTSSGTAPALGNGTITGAYIQTGKRIEFRIVLTMGSTTTFGTGTYDLSLPAFTASAGMGRASVGGTAFDSSATSTYPIVGLILASATTATLRAWPTTAGNALAAITPTVPFTFATSDVITISGTYEAA